MRAWVSCLTWAMMTLVGPAATAGPSLYLIVDGAPCHLFLGCPSPRPRFVEVDLGDGRIVREIPVAAAQASSPDSLGVSADGRYVFWTDQPSQFTNRQDIRLLDVTTGLSALVGQDFFLDRFSHPSTVRVFARGILDRILAIEPSRQRAMTFPDCTAVSLRAMSGDGSRLLVGCGSGNLVPRALVVDGDSGMVVATLPLSAYAAFNETGSEVFTVSAVPTNPPGTFIIRRLHTASGTELASYTEHKPGIFGRLFSDRRTGRVFFATSREVLVFDPITLHLLARIPLPGDLGSHSMVFEPNRPFAYLLHQGQDATFVGVVDTEHLTSLGLYRLPYQQRAWSFGIAPEPPAPVDLSATVSASTVTLAWQRNPRSPAITQFELEAGTASGLSNIGRVFTTDDSESLVITNVPPGEYFVRVRARNYSGSGPPSNEIHVTVVNSSR